MRRADGTNSGASIQLTERERECLQWSARGLSSKQIAEQLGISVGAVDVHCGKAAKKLSSISRIQAVARAVKFGIVEI